MLARWRPATGHLRCIYSSWKWFLPTTCSPKKRSFSQPFWNGPIKPDLEERSPNFASSINRQKKETFQRNARLRQFTGLDRTFFSTQTIKRRVNKKSYGQMERWIKTFCTGDDSTVGQRSGNAPIRGRCINSSPGNKVSVTHSRNYKNLPINEWRNTWCGSLGFRIDLDFYGRVGNHVCSVKNDNVLNDGVRPFNYGAIKIIYLLLRRYNFLERPVIHRLFLSIDFHIGFHGAAYKHLDNPYIKSDVSKSKEKTAYVLQNFSGTTCGSWKATTGLDESISPRQWKCHMNNNE